MTSSDRISIRDNSKLSAREHRRREICSIYLNNIHEYCTNEFNRDSAIYIYTNRTYNNRVWVKCKYMNRSDNNRGG